METSVTNFNLKTDKVYYIIYGNNNWGIYQFVDKLKLDDYVFLQCISLDGVLDSAKTTYVPFHFIQKITEFDSLSDYKTRLEAWNENQDEKKFKSGS